MSAPIGLYGIADSGIARDVPLLDKVRAYLDAGVKLVQLRMKSESSRQILEIARQAVALCREASAQLILNDRPDLAILADADGVHVGREDLPTAEVRRLMGPSKIVGSTVRGLPEALLAAEAGASYVGFGPVFGTRTKVLPVAPRGLEALHAVVLGSPIPVVAIGGIGPTNIASVAGTGVSGAAVVSAVLESADLVVAARELAKLFAGGRA